MNQRQIQQLVREAELDYMEALSVRCEKATPREPRQVNPYLRSDPGYQFRDMFPVRDSECACGCGKVLEGRRTRWATNECHKEPMRLYDIRCGRAKVVREALMARDAGVCAGCGIVCEMMVRCREKRNIYLRLGSANPWKCALQRPYGKPYHAARTIIPWEAHHIVPVSEGGGGCDLDGYVILCRACHGKETGQLRRRLARKQRGQLALDITT